VSVFRLPARLVARPRSTPSAGLGLSRAEWAALHGMSIGQGFIGSTYKGGIEAAFHNDRLFYVWRHWRLDEQAPAERPRQLGVKFAPKDSESVEAYTTVNPLGDPLAVWRYNSPWLASRFPAEQFTAGEPGDFTVGCNLVNGSITVMIGNNP
jgi:hypothetical protein